jgi:hypothetical protein
MAFLRKADRTRERISGQANRESSVARRGDDFLGRSGDEASERRAGRFAEIES